MLPFGPTISVPLLNTVPAGKSDVPVGVRLLSRLEVGLVLAFIMPEERGFICPEAIEEPLKSAAVVGAALVRAGALSEASVLGNAVEEIVAPSTAAAAGAIAYPAPAPTRAPIPAPPRALFKTLFPLKAP